ASCRFPCVERAEPGEPARRPEQHRFPGLPSVLESHRAVLRPDLLVRSLNRFARLVCAAAMCGAVPLGLALPPFQEAALAERFAPVFVFHQHEEFFPCSPLADLSLPGYGRDLEGLGRLESIASRIRTYAALPLDEKLAKATVFYRVRSADADWRVAYIEYWLY